MLTTVKLRELLDRFPKAQLALNPTPLHSLRRTQNNLHCGPLFVKRDDLNGLGIGGNKVRNLEYLLGDAVAKGKETILVSGQTQSNLCALCAAACCRLGLKCVIVHNNEQPKLPCGNALLNNILGAEEYYLGEVNEESRAKTVDELYALFEQKGQKPYVIFNGASTAIGALGYVEAAAEICEQIAADPSCSCIRYVCVPGGNGGLAAGFIYGTALLGNPFHVEVISVEHTVPELREILVKLLGELEELCGIPMPCSLDDTATLRDEYRFGGWGIIDPKVEEFNLQFMRTEGILIEKVYTGKALYGVCDLARSGYFQGGACYLHSGGVGALFSQYHSAEG